MRTITTLILSAILSLSVCGQTLPNSSFEDWHTTMGALEPDFWSISPEVLALGANPMAERSTDAHSGNYAAKIVTLVVNILGNETSGRGILYNETALPLAGRPDSVVVWLKYLPDGDHEYALRADLTAWDAQQQTAVPVALGTYVGGLTPEYTRISFPFSYSSGIMPDSVIFTFYNDFPDEVFGLNTALWVDDLSLVYPQELSTLEAADVNDKLFPVPADEVMNVQTNEVGNWYIYDMQGRMQQAIDREENSDFQINTGTLNTGCYFLQSPNGTVSKFLVEHH